MKRYIKRLLNNISPQAPKTEEYHLLLGRVLSEAIKNKKQIKSLKEVEFKVFSQFGDDGIIQWLVNNLDISSTSFIEFGVEDFKESNTRFLMMNDNWSGFVMDGSESSIDKLMGAEYFWQYQLTAKAIFIDRDNISGLLSAANLGKNIGLLHIDLDGNDYWIWEAITEISSDILILEYNSVFGKERAITVPYDKGFYRTKAHTSNLYFGASLKALYNLSKKKGYAFIGCNSAGNNAYFIKNEKLNDVVRECSLEQGFVESKFRESRDSEGKLSYLNGEARLAEIKGMPVYNVETNEIEEL
ncbi:hypothetical protein PQO03_09625 [Lentisphaera profundi]|uniref:NADH dehydrogenase n=1 Tax=Lentisphaera profundi TaxID=1658616 RepID=A0ABY7VPR6_9BACT|nr:hypothetical protein [Lentisphaera profundi]WDE95972.1 hypothetical protein PQO03_09625 [Lentisphaera profundi]